MKDRHTPNEGAIDTIKHDGKLYYARLLKAPLWRDSTLAAIDY